MSKEYSKEIINQSVAIIGLEGRFPGAANVDQFWQNIIDKKDVRRLFSEEELQANGVSLNLLQDPNYIKAGYVLDDIAVFDAPFFKISPVDALMMDPQQRLMLESAYLCLESAGYNHDLRNSNVGIFIGAALSTYFLQNYDPEHSVHKSLEGMQHLLMNESIATYLAYKLDCTGPAITLNTTCSSSLVAVHYACSSLLSYECDMALSGGVSIDSNQETGYLHREGWLSSPDGYCRPFDEQAEGTIPGNGLGVVLLKRLEDALSDGDYIYAIIRGSAVNNDGADKVGYTAPSFVGQSRVISEALLASNVDARDISLLETHGTGTPIGDPLEIAALTNAYRQFTADNQFCAIGSVKSNIGHLNAASGIAGLIKVVKALENNILPPTVNYSKPNEKINFDQTPFFVNIESKSWGPNSQIKYACVSSFGVGGTNAHVILQSSSPLKKSKTSNQCQLILLSAKSSHSLIKKKVEFVNYINQHHLSVDIAYTLATTRYPESYRSSIVIGKKLNNEGLLNAPDFYFNGEKPNIVFMFAGQGAQYSNMFCHLYERYPIFQEYLNDCLGLLDPHYGIDLKSILFTKENSLESKVHDTFFTQPILFSVEYALAKTLLALGVKPSAMIGHSIGEYVCACVSGVLSLNDTIKIIIARSKLFLDIDAGCMLAAKLTPELACLNISERISLAAINSQENCVFSGDTNSILKLKAQFDQDNIGNVLLKTSHAFHSYMLEPKLKVFESVIKSITVNHPQIPYISNVTGDWADFEIISKVEYWSKHLRDTVLFAQGIDKLTQLSNIVFLEVSPKQTLSNIVKSGWKDNPTVINIDSNSANHSDEAKFLEAIGTLWCRGIDIEWDYLYQRDEHQRIPIRLNPFVGQKYWINREQNSLVRTDQNNWYYSPVWKREPKYSDSVKNDQKKIWLIFCNQSSLSNEIQTQLLADDQSVIKIMRGTKYQVYSNRSYAINPDTVEQYKRVIAEIFSEQSPCYIIHLWGLDSDCTIPLTYEEFLVSQKNTFYSSLYMIQALGCLNVSKTIHISFLTHYAYSVLKTEKVNYSQTSIAGAIKVISQEYPNFHCCHIDIGIEEDPKKVASKIISENLRDLPRDIVAFRNNYTWVPDFQKVVIQHKKELKTKGTYLIIGGLGQIGLTLAKHLYHKYQVNLILTQKSDLPPNEEVLAQIISEHRHPMYERFMTIKELREQGANILTFSLDVCDYHKLEQIYFTAKEKFSKIDGIIHAAGTIDASAFFYIGEITRDYCDDQFKTKVAGMLNVYKLLQNEVIDFVCLFSSISSLLGGLRHFAYAAANACLDAFVEDRENWLTINWDGWLFKNTSERMNIDPSKLPSLYLTPEEGVQCFENSLGLMPCSQIIISTGDFHKRLLSWSSAQLKPKLFKKMYQRPQTATEFVGPSNKTQCELCEIWKMLLGLDTMGIEDNFFELGGDSLLATQFALQIRKSYALDIPMRLFFDQPTIRALSEFIDNDQNKQKLQSTLTKFLNDLKLCELIITENKTSVSSKNDNVLLTGATGFLGVHLLAEICAQTDACVYCLVKAGDYNEAKQKLINQLNYYGIEIDHILPKVKIVLGDLEKVSLGLNQDDYNMLACKIDTIYHNGAKVHHLYDYSQLRAANVMSTLEIIKLASECHQKSIHYISTIIAATEKDSGNCIVEDFLDQVVPDILGGYQQSKWIAEKLLADAHKKGISVTIYRPNLIIGQFETGITSPNGSHFLSLIKGCIQMKCAPDWMRILDMMPVDYLAQIIIKFSLLQDVQGKVFNLINPHSPMWLNLIEWLKEDGYTLDVIPVEKWINEHLVKIDQSNALYQLMTFYLGSAKSEPDEKPSESKVRTDLTQSYLDRVNLVYPVINKTIFKPHLNYLRSVNYI
jgi:thioester reductase-like protein